jgi:hypothetical protein
MEISLIEFASSNVKLDGCPKTSPDCAFSIVQETSSPTLTQGDVSKNVTAKYQNGPITAQTSASKLVRYYRTYSLTTSLIDAF